MPSSPAITLLYEFLNVENIARNTYLWKLFVFLSDASLLNGFFEFVITDSPILDLSGEKELIEIHAKRTMRPAETFP